MKERPTEFVKVYASLVPREIWADINAVTEMDDAELDRVIDAIRQRLITARQEMVVVDVTPKTPPALRAPDDDDRQS